MRRGSEPAFVREDVTACAKALQADIPAQLARMRAALEAPVPDVPPAAQYARPYQSPISARCNSGQYGGLGVRRSSP